MATHTATYYTKRTIGLLLLISLAAVFLFSALSKLDAFYFLSDWKPFAAYKRIDNFTAFTYTFLDILPIGMTTAGVLARLFAGLELVVGLFLLGQVYLKKVTYPATIALLALLSIYLVMLLLKQGNTGNCGCFGETHPMTPVAALIKNAIMIAATVVLMFIYPGKVYKNSEYAAPLLTMCGLVVPFILNPLHTDIASEKMQQFIDLNSVYSPKAVPIPSVDLRKGKHVVAYFSLTCPHCRKGAYLMQIIHQQHPDYPLYMIMNGRAQDLTPFLDQTKAGSVPYTYMADLDAFKTMSGESVPAIYYINNSVIVRKLGWYGELDPKDIGDWIKQ